MASNIASEEDSDEAAWQIPDLLFLYSCQCLAAGSSVPGAVPALTSLKEKLLLIKNLSEWKPWKITHGVQLWSVPTCALCSEIFTLISSPRWHKGKLKVTSSSPCRAKEVPRTWAVLRFLQCSGQHGLQTTSSCWSIWFAQQGAVCGDASLAQRASCCDAGDGSWDIWSLLWSPQPKSLLSTQVRERGLAKSHMTLWFCRNSDIEHSVSQGFRQWQVFPIGNLPLHQRQQHWRVNPEKKHYWQKKHPIMWKKTQKWCRCDCFPCLQGT